MNPPPPLSVFSECLPSFDRESKRADRLPPTHTKRTLSFPPTVAFQTLSSTPLCPHSFSLPHALCSLRPSHSCCFSRSFWAINHIKKIIKTLYPGLKCPKEATKTHWSSLFYFNDPTSPRSQTLGESCQLKAAFSGTQSSTVGDLAALSSGDLLGFQQVMLGIL